MRTLIVDDEAIARRRLRRLLDELGGVEVVGEASDGLEAAARIAELSPELVLLDIQMPGLDGMELTLTTPEMPHVVFTTAHQEHAVKAFEASAIDFLLKPIRRERLEAALDKVRSAASRPTTGALKEALREVIGGEGIQRIAARHGGSLELFDPREIERFSAKGGYASFRHGGREYLIEETIASLAERLERSGFMRVHRSELIRLDAVRAIDREGDSIRARLVSGDSAPVGRSRLSELKRSLGID